MAPSSLIRLELQPERTSARKPPNGQDRSAASKIPVPAAKYAIPSVPRPSLRGVLMTRLLSCVALALFLCVPALPAADEKKADDPKPPGKATVAVFRFDHVNETASE